MTPARFAVLARQVARGIVRLERDEVCCGDLTLQQSETLRAIEATGALTVSAAASAFGIDVSTASRNPGLLARKGYLTRRRGREDARQVAFALSKKGRGCLASLCCDERLVYAALLARLPADRRDAVGDALEVLVAALSAEVRADAWEGCSPGPCCPTKEKAR